MNPKSTPTPKSLPEKIIGAVLVLLVLIMVVTAGLAAIAIKGNRDYAAKVMAVERAAQAASVAEQPDLNTRVVCHKVAALGRDSQSGMVNLPELRPRLQELYSRAKFNPVLEPSLRQMLRALADPAMPNVTAFGAGADALKAACRGIQ